MDDGIETPNINPLDGTETKNLLNSQPISREEATKILEERYINQGIPAEQATQFANDAVDSFEGDITTRMVLDGDTFVINHTGGESASGRYVIKKEDADKTPKELQTDLALPYNNSANAQAELTITEPHQVLEGEVANQSQNSDYFPSSATGGGQQTFIDDKKTDRNEIFGDK
ncbi:hypothetical protein [Sulfurovum sp.]|uniref:hypothetical protein n=1 Tax=Sulfurovum sp. TaxID=1969726 RepID=UPI0025EADB04|nr:hypothetical protein [Sulfurovum sp.]